LHSVRLRATLHQPFTDRATGLSLLSPRQTRHPGEYLNQLPNLPAPSYPLLAGTVLPIFVAEGDSILGFCGSGFLLGKGIFVTCWHCVSERRTGRRHVVGVLAEGNDSSVVDLRDVEQDAAGSDLAIGLVEAQPSLPFRLAPAPYVLIGHDVWSFGYPYTDRRLTETGGCEFTLNGRILRGYATRTFPYDHPKGVRVESYELDMPAPKGMSGAPLVMRGGFEVAGVMFGTHDVELVDDECGPGQRYQTTRVVSFGLAHTAETLRGASTSATKAIPLGDFLGK
jgi:hypothetical protein